jgi:hypothetical protein
VPRLFKQLLLALSLMAVCVVIHATGMASALRRLRGQASRSTHAWSLCWLFVRVAGLLILLHLAVSGVTYTTTGYGDLVLPPAWRLVGAVEALTGILMCGWSTGFIFAIVDRAFEAKSKSSIQPS